VDKKHKIMKIYFAGSITGGREDSGIYKEIISKLSQYGEVLTEHIGLSKLSDKGETDMSDKFIHDRDIDWLMQSDVIVADVSVTSLGVGYEIGRAVENNKRVICLYRKQDSKRLSAMISGSDKVETYYYKSISDIEELFAEILRK